MIYYIKYGIIYALRKECDSMKNNNLTENEINEKIRKVDGAMAQEGMPLTEEIKKKLYNCLTGKTTTDIERRKVLERYKKIYG